MKYNNKNTNTANAADATPDTLNIQNSTLNIISAGCTPLIAQTLVDAQPSTHCVDEVLAFNTELVVEQDSTVVVNFTWPEMNSTGTESVQLPKRPFMALRPPGPVVTLTTPSFCSTRA